MDNDTIRVWLDSDRLIVAHRYGGCYGVVTVGNTGIDADEELSELPPGAVELAPDTATMTIQCPCGWTATGPATHVQKTVFHHRCAQTDPTWNQQERELVVTALRELLDQTYLGDEATDLAWKQHNAAHALMFVDGDPRA